MDRSRIFVQYTVEYTQQATSPTIKTITILNFNEINLEIYNIYRIFAI
jgi:hypothetical protein